MSNFSNIREGVKYYIRGKDGIQESFVGTFKSYAGGDFEFISDGRSIWVNPQDVEEIKPLSGGRRKNTRKSKKSRKSRKGSRKGSRKNRNRKGSRKN